MTTAPSEKQKKLVLIAAALVDGLMISYAKALATLKLKLRRARSASDVEMALAGFELELDTIIRQGTAGMPAEVAREFLSLWGLNTNGILLPYPLIISSEALMSQRVRSAVERGRLALELAARITGQSSQSLAPLTVLTTSEAYDIRKTLDAAFSGLAQMAIVEAGRPHFERKQAIPVLDDRTTELCRDEMAWQIQPWDKPFVHAPTGSRWMAPPFIGANLPPKKRFHFCRTGVAPA